MLRALRGSVPLPSRPAPSNPTGPHVQSDGIGRPGAPLSAFWPHEATGPPVTTANPGRRRGTMTGHRWLRLALAGLAMTTAAACDTTSPSEPGALVPRTVAEDASLPAIEMNGARFHVRTLGNPANPVIVFLHGGPGGDHRSMLRLAERFGGRSLA